VVVRLPWTLAVKTSVVAAAVLPALLSVMTLLLLKNDMTSLLCCTGRHTIAVASYNGMIKLWQYRKRYVPD